MKEISATKTTNDFHFQLNSKQASLLLQTKLNID